MEILALISVHIIDWLIHLDKYVFVLINSVFTNKALDSIYPWWREGATWTPLYVFILSFMFLNFGKRTWPWLAFILFNVLLSDQVSSTLFKNYFMRLRPCSDPMMQYQVRLLLDHCSGGYSFTSSHATNHFGFVMFITQTLKPFISKYRWPLFLWAGSIAYGQVYVGVHYPLDVICGALLGCMLGFMLASIYNRRIAKYYPFSMENVIESNKM